MVIMRKSLTKPLNIQVFCSKSVHFRASLAALALNSVNDGNDDEVNAENDVHGAFK